MTLKDLSKLILLTQDIRETSWDKEHSVYELDTYDAASIAAEVLGLEPDLSHLAGLMCSTAWNDFQMWALTINAKPGCRTYEDFCKYWFEWENVHMPGRHKHGCIIAKVIKDQDKKQPKLQ